MNKDDRNRLADIATKLSELQSEIVCLAEEMQERADMYGEHFEGTARHEEMEEKCTDVDDAASELEGVIDTLNELAGA